MIYERILVTGANGLLGQALVRRLSASVLHDVMATSNDDAPRFTGLSCGYVRLDVCDRVAVSRIFEDFAPTVVINCAAMTNVDRCETDRNACWCVNAISVEHLANECHAIGAHLVQISTDFVFDGTTGPYTETDRPNPINFYGKAKLAGENAARKAGYGKWTVVRTNVVYGSNKNLPRHNFASWVYQQLSSGHTVQAFVDQIRTPTYACDLARGIESIVRCRKRGIYNLSGGALLSMYDFAREIANTAGFDSSLVGPTDSRTLSQVAPRPPVTGFIILRAETELSFRPRTVAEALTHMGYCRSVSNSCSK